MKRLTKQDLEKLNHHKQVLFACFCAEQVIHLVEEKHKQVCLKAIKVAYLFLEGKATKEDCQGAAYAATAANAAAAAAIAAYAAAYAANAATYAADAAAYAATYAAYAANAAAYAANAATYAAYVANAKKQNTQQ